MLKTTLPTIVISIACIMLSPSSLTGEECDPQKTQSECTDAQTDKSTGAADTDTGQLPAAELDKVKDHHVKLRYFKAIGFLKKSDLERDAIATIFAKYDLPVPEEYQK